MKKMEVKMTMRYHYAQIKMAKVQNTDDTKSWWGTGVTVILIHCWCECKIVVTLEDCLALSNKAKHTLNIWSSNHTTLYSPKWTENLHSYKNLHVDVYSSFVYNCQNLDAAKMSFSKWMDKQTVVHPDNAISTEKEMRYQAIKRHGTNTNTYY